MHTSFSLHVFQIKDGHSCGFTACTGRGRNLHTHRKKTHIKLIKIIIWKSVSNYIFSPETGRFASCTSDKWLQCACNRLSFSNWCIHKVQKFCVWVRCVEIGGFAGVNHRAPSHCNIHIKMSPFGKSDCFFKTVKKKKQRCIKMSWHSNTITKSRPTSVSSLMVSPFVRWLYSHILKDLIFHSMRRQWIQYCGDGWQASQISVCHQTYVTRSHILQILIK